MFSISESIALTWWHEKLICFSIWYMNTQVTMFIFLNHRYMLLLWGLFYSTSQEKTQPLTLTSNPGVRSIQTSSNPWPAWQVETLELLRALVPDTLRAKAVNGATPAHDAAFQGEMGRFWRCDSVIGDSCYQETDVIWGFCFSSLFCVFLENEESKSLKCWRFWKPLKEHVQLLSIFTSQPFEPECLSRTAKTKGILRFWSSFTTLHQAHCWRDHM